MHAINTILVLTDFSENAVAAENYALRLAVKIKGSLILYNVYPADTVNSLGGNVVWPHDSPLSSQLSSFSNLALRVSELNNALTTYDSSDHKPTITHLNDEGSLAGNLNNVILKHSVGLVVMGTKGEGFAHTLFFGSNVFKVLPDMSVPLLIVPEQAAFHQISTVAYATDLRSSDVETMKWLKIFAEQLHAKLLVTNISENSPDNDDNIAEKVTSDLLFYLKTNETKVENFYGRNVEETLHEIVAHRHIDILVLLHRKQGFFESLAHAGTTHKMVRHTQLPILVLQ